MFERLTERSRRVVYFAQEEAAKRKHGEMAAEHLLLASLREKDTVCCRILDRMGISIKNIREEIEQHITGSLPATEGDITLAISARRVIDYANEEADQINNPYIGTEHLLLGLIREGMDNSRELTGRALRNAGVELEPVRREVLALQDDSSGFQPRAPHGTRLEQFDAALRETRPSKDDTPPNAAQALSSSRLAGRVFDREFQKLTPPEQAIMQAEGLPLSQLSPILQELLRFTTRTAQAANEDHIQAVPAAANLTRVRVDTQPDSMHYIVSSDVTLVTTMLVRDDVG